MLLGCILKCLTKLKRVRRMSLATLPPSGRRHDRQCTRTSAAIQLLSLDPELRLDDLMGIEISSEFQCCHVCTAAITAIFERFLPRLKIVKFDSTASLLDRGEQPLLRDAETIYIRTDWQDRDDTALLDALSLWPMCPKVRKLVLHSSCHFIDVRELDFSSTQLVLHNSGGLSLVSAGRRQTFQSARIVCLSVSRAIS